MFDTNISLKLEIKDKKQFIKNTLLVIVLLGLVAICLWQTTTSIGLKKTLVEKKAELARAQKTSKHLKKLERQAQDLTEKEAAILKQVPLDEKHPFSLIKTLTTIADTLGLQKAGFRVKEESLAENTFGIETQGAPMADEETGDTMVSQETQTVSYQATAQTLKPLRFEMTFNGTYAQLLALLQKIHTLERMITIEHIAIERKKEIVPLQAIVLHLTAYTFSNE